MKNTENAAVKMPPALLAEMLGTEPEYKALSETLSAFKAGGAAYRAGGMLRNGGFAIRCVRFCLRCLYTTKR